MFKYTICHIGGERELEIRNYYIILSKESDIYFET